MESYDIQHDFLFSPDEMASDAPAYFDKPQNKRELKRSIPLKASIFLRSDGETMLLAFQISGKPILLINDLPKTDNPIVEAYSTTLIKGVSAKLQSMKLKVFKG